MDQRKYQFLKAVLGEDGAKALRKAAERSQECEAVLVPRAILAWLNLAIRDGYEGDLPGINNTYLAFKKSEEAFSGSVSMGEDVYRFDRASLFHLASAIAVAIGVDGDRFHPDLRDLDIVRLGKSIDLLAKARSVAERLANEEILVKAISLIPPGAEIREPKAATSKTFDYSHVLPPQHQKMGYKMQVRHRPESGTVTAHVYRNGLEVGQVKGMHENGALNIEDAEVNEEHQGRGLGSSMYEALMAHAHHSGVPKVAGSIHSTMASGVHKKLAAKHGMDYKQTPTPSPQLAARTPGPYDNRMGPYEYTIKEEVPANKAEAPGPAHAATPAQMPEPQAAPTTQVQKGPTVPKLPKPKLPKVSKSLKITKSQSERKCGLCGLPQFKGGNFNGCLCLRDLAKHARAVADGDGFVIEFRAEWDNEAIETLVESLE